ncbi:MAG: 3-phosphoglycerate dehydrogenase [Xanthomonadales bacterium]|nr:3-phosphoglycerate dehydrogenase [Xanthomonadales bacterium]NIX14194.1 3-phosphoglycerate dehydrogenase [Xanthomonadales bacterium]
MFNIRTYNRISEKGLGRFDPENYRLGEDLADPDAYILRSHKLHGEAVPDSLLAVARAGAGYNNIPVDDYTHRGIVVFNTPGANANAVKELVVAGLVLGSRGVFDGIRYVQSLGDVSDATDLAKALEREKKRFAGTELAGKKLGIIGLGAIGSMVANMALELDMRVAGFDPALSVEAAWRLSSRVERVESLGALLGEADYLSLHVPVNEHTRNLIDADAIGRMKPGARLLNFAREEIVDIAAVVEALDAGQLARYVTDFPRPELLGREDTVLLPHIGASTREAEENCAVMAAEQLMDFLENGNIVNSVNFPQTRMARNGGHRLTFWNDNVPRVLGAVLAVFADRNVNVIDLVNKSHGDVAYNIIDLETPPGPHALEEVGRVEGVIRLRTV